MKSLISAAQGPVISVVVGVGAGVAGVGAGVAAVLLLPPNIPVSACPATLPTAEPTATPPAVAAICLNIEGCSGCDTMGWDGGAVAGTLE